LSVAPASAGNSDAITASQLSLTAAAASVDTTGICAASAGTSSAAPRVMQVGGTQQVALATNGTGRLVLSGNAEWKTTPSSAVSYDANKRIATTAATGNFVFTATSVGNFTLISTTTGAPATALDTFYFTVVSSCSTAVSVANSFVQVGASSSNIETASAWATRQTALNATEPTGGSASGLDTSNDSYTTFANDDTAYIAVRARDAYTVDMTGTNTLTVSCDNGAKVGGTGLGFYSNSSFTAHTGTSNIAVVQATSGVPMSTTCTVQFNGVTLATKKIKFMGDLAKIVIAPSRNGNIETGTAGRFSYKLYDSADNLLTGTVGTLTAGPTLFTVAEYVNADYYAASTAYVSAQGADKNPSYQTGGYGKFQCNDYGTADMSIYKYAASGAKITSNVINLACGGAPFTWTASLDKASYKMGEIATLTITAKDIAGGVPAYAAVLSGLSVALPNMTYVVQPSASDTETTPRAGVWTYTYTVNNGTSVAGSYNGAVKVTVGSTSSQYNKAVTIPYTIQGDGTVSNAEVLAAIVKLIASINKQIKALQKSLRR